MTKSARSSSAAALSGPEDFARAFDVSRETIDKLGIYVSLLSQWQKRINLVAHATLTGVWHRHVADSAQLVALAPNAGTWVDLGSGGGFPGLVVAIMLHEAGTRVTLVESDRRKCRLPRRSCPPDRNPCGDSNGPHRTNRDSGYAGAG